MKSNQYFVIATDDDEGPEDGPPLFLVKSDQPGEDWTADVTQAGCFTMADAQLRAAAIERGPGKVWIAKARSPFTPWSYC